MKTKQLIVKDRKGWVLDIVDVPIVETFDNCTQIIKSLGNIQVATGVFNRAIRRATQELIRRIDRTEDEEHRIVLEQQLKSLLCCK